MDGLSSSSAKVWVEEEKTFDTEVTHLAETLSYLAIEEGLIKKGT